MDHGGREFRVYAIFGGLIVLCLFAFAGSVAHAEKTGGWQGEPDYVLDWLGAQRTPDGRVSCCGVGDAINVEIVGEDDQGIALRITNGRGHAPEGAIIHAARDRLVKTNLDPDGNAVAWISFDMHVYCLSVPPRV